jgi:excisionase family DNA binding protein
MKTLEPLNVAIPEAARLIGCGRSTVYLLLKSGQLRSISIGTRRLVTMASIRELNDALASKAA